MKKIIILLAVASISTYFTSCTKNEDVKLESNKTQVETDDFETATREPIVMDGKYYRNQTPRCKRWGSACSTQAKETNPFENLNHIEQESFNIFVDVVNEGSTDALMNYFQSEQSFLLKDLLALRPEIIEGLQNGNILIINETIDTDNQGYFFYQESVSEDNLLIVLEY